MEEVVNVGAYDERGGGKFVPAVPEESRRENGFGLEPVGQFYRDYASIWWAVGV